MRHSLKIDAVQFTKLTILVCINSGVRYEIYDSGPLFTADGEVQFLIRTLMYFVIATRSRRFSEYLLP